MNEYEYRGNTGTNRAGREGRRAGSTGTNRVRSESQRAGNARTDRERPDGQRPAGTRRARPDGQRSVGTRRARPDGQRSAGTRRARPDSQETAGTSRVRADGQRPARRRRSGQRAGYNTSGYAGSGYFGGTGYRAGRALQEMQALEAESEREYQEYQERKRRRQLEQHRAQQQRQKQVEQIKKLAGFGLIFLVVLLLGYKLFFSNPVEKKVTMEAGVSKLKTEDFLRKKKVEAEFVTDVSKLDLNHVAEYEIVLKAKGKERKSRLILQDTTAPKAEADPITVDVDGKLEAEELVKDIKDNTDVKCSFKENPDLSKTGTVSAVVVLTDEGGNTAEVKTEIEVIKDDEEPKIDGVAPLTGFIGDPISYKSGITVTDNCDREVKLEVDNSDVDTESEGTYDVVYTATDRAGNEATAKTTITMKEKPENYVEPEEVAEEADEVLEEITTEDMTLKEKARAIYDWARENIGYVSTSEKESWTNGAHQGFTEQQGDCFIFFATSKALLTQAGIPNIDVEKSDTSHSRHYWSLINCGDGWYHFDTTPRQGGGEFFMKTDEEILTYSRAHDNSHIFDQSLYPATPTEDSTID